MHNRLWGHGWIADILKPMKAIGWITHCYFRLKYAARSEANMPPASDLHGGSCL